MERGDGGWVYIGNGGIHLQLESTKSGGDYMGERM